MGDQPVKSDKSFKEDCKQYVFLKKDGRLICRTQCLNPPENLHQCWSIHDIVKRSELTISPDLPHFSLCPAPESTRDKNEWRTFLAYLHKRDKVAISKSTSCRFYILPPEADIFTHVRVAYEQGKASNKHISQKHDESVVDTTEVCPFVRKNMDLDENCSNSSTMSPMLNVKKSASEKDRCVKFPESTDELKACDLTKRHRSCSVKRDAPLVKNYVRADPSYLQTLGQAHSGWIFGAIAELVDNSRDAKASRLDISVEIVYSKRAGKRIPMLSIIDDGCGMNHREIEKMTCFGHKKPDADDVDHIGRFGVGFKTGSMRLGKDALVLTQTANSRSIAFLSQSLNEGKDDLEIPIISYRRKGQFMEIDTNVQSEASAKHNLKALKEFSHFDKYLIGEKAGLFQGNHRATGTQIYIWNLDEWGTDYCLEWTAGVPGGSSFHKGDIHIRSRRVRSRPGQMSQKVPLDYSLRSYLEVIFLVPRIRIYVQGSLVKSRPLARSLNQTCEVTGNICGKSVRLTLGRCQLEWEQSNCGMFLYWHGRLIEAYKRVGGMVHSGDVGRGVIGVIDVTDLMDDARVWVLNNKQGFPDCEPYVRLEEWLGRMADEYWDKNYDTVQLDKSGLLYKPDDEWVQCDKCRKWRMLSGYDSNNLPLEWFCYMKPFEGSCETPEQKVQRGVITVSTKRSGYASPELEDDATITSEGDSDGDFDDMKNARQGLRRIRKGLPRACKKAKS
ncbi:MORC family CW-type zinc finger protein 3 [Euphorbia peplus]|nr:MORC family CW-type zinc finger protein 3 [Euphorbia peplus]